MANIETNINSDSPDHESYLILRNQVKSYLTSMAILAVIWGLWILACLCDS